MSNQAIAIDINDFAGLLISHNVMQNAESLYVASGRLRNTENVNEWSYECCNLEFSIEGTIAGTIPQQIGFVEIVFNISVSGVFSDSSVIINNPISKLNFDIELKGWNNNAENFFASWHLDKHIPGGNDPSFIHPEYHLTFGGNKLEDKGVDNFGSALILPSPRIAYPPMDVILGIDFILQNFFPLDKISNLLNDTKYKEIVSNSQKRLWRPYYISTSSAWVSFENLIFQNDFKFNNLNPHIISVS